MSFWSQSDSRRTRPNNDTNNLASRSGQFFRDENPESDMFFETTPNLTFGRSHLADRIGSAVFEDFPSRRTMRSFPSHDSAFSSRHHPPSDWEGGWRSPSDHVSQSSSPKSEGRDPFGSRRRSRQHEDDWTAAGTDQATQNSSPKTERWTTTLRRPFFQRSESIPVRVMHENRGGSRASTPESTGSGHSHGSGHSKSHSDDREPEGAPEGVEEHPGVSARTGRQSFTARRQPKVHHIPIHVEPRDGSQQTVVLTPPAESAATTPTTDTVSPSEPRHRTVFAMPAPENVRRTPPEEPQPTEAPDLAEETGPDDQSEDGGGAIPTPPPLDGQKMSAVQLVERVQRDVAALEKEVAEFGGRRGDKRYVYLDEMLTRNLIKLDNISTEGNEELRRARRAVVVAINNCIQLLEQRAILGEGSAAVDGHETKPSEVAVASDVARDEAVAPSDEPARQSSAEEAAAATQTKDETMEVSEETEKPAPSSTEMPRVPSEPTEALTVADVTEHCESPRQTDVSTQLSSDRRDDAILQSTTTGEIETVSGS